VLKLNLSGRLLIPWPYDRKALFTADYPCETGAVGESYSNLSNSSPVLNFVPKMAIHKVAVIQLHPKVVITTIFTKNTL
jgi:hypothetical protein